jgi:hypothetical protein
VQPGARVRMKQMLDEEPANPRFREILGESDPGVLGVCPGISGAETPGTVGPGTTTARHRGRHELAPAPLRTSKAG